MSAVLNGSDPTSQDPDATNDAGVASPSKEGPDSDENVRAGEQPANGSPWIVEEHHVTGPYGEDELEATDSRGRHWYQLRPQARTRADLLGFNYMWWIFTIFVLVLLFLPW